MNDLETGLRDLVRSEISREDVWGHQMKIFRNAFEPTGVLTEAELDKLLDVSLLRWPYFTLLRKGAVPDVEKYTVSRNVIGHAREGFIDGPAVRTFMSGGATLKLNRMSDWNPTSKRIRALLEELLPVAVSCYGFWTPTANRGMLPHRDASHVLVLQLSGQKRWNLFASEGEVKSSAGLDVNAESGPSHEFTLNPGDILYLPHGWPHDAEGVGDESSLHITFTMAEPNPEDLLQGILGNAVDPDNESNRRFHTLDLPTRTTRVRDELMAVVNASTAQEWSDLALVHMREKTG